MQGTFASFLTCGQCFPNKKTILFIDPGFPVQKQQITVMGYQYESFDVYHYRGNKLREILEKYLSKGNIAAIIYSNPNNPAWFCLTDEELQIIGELSDKYNTIVIEDLAYFARVSVKISANRTLLLIKQVSPIILITIFYKFLGLKHSATQDNESVLLQSLTNYTIVHIQDNSNIWNRDIWHSIYT